MALRRLTVFSGSRHGARPAYTAAATNLAQVLARRKISLVYGGSSIGLMGELARAAVAAGVPVVGVIPQLLVDREVAFTGLSDLRIVTSMADRKALMADLADAFLVLPGGIGTLDEFFEMVSWTQLGLQQKPCGVLNVEGYYDRLVSFLDDAVREGFIAPESRPIIVVDDSAERLLDRLERWRQGIPG